MTEPGVPARGGRAFKARLDRIYLGYTAAFIAFVLALGAMERIGLPKRWIGAIFLLSTVALYAAIGIFSRTTNAAEYYVAGRRVPAMYNGMATGADWMSAASFIGLAGTLYLQGYGGLAFVMGWTGGYCLVALLLAPYLRKFGEFTIPDFLAARFGGNWPRLIGVIAAILCSFVYLVAQLYGVGLITARLIGVDFVVGIFLGLGGVLVCSFLGGMRAVTWTQVAQYIILVIAYLVPVVWLSVKQTGVPVPQVIYGYQLEKVTQRELVLLADPKEQEVSRAFQALADDYRARLRDVPRALALDREVAERTAAQLRLVNAPLAQIQVAEKAVAVLPKNEAAARELWFKAAALNEARAKPLGGMPPHAQPFAGDPHAGSGERTAYSDSRTNFLALVFCLMLGTAGLPHILTRCYTTPSVQAARESVAWSLFFILLLYLTAPALAVLIKYEVFTSVVGLPFDQLPAWIGNWSKVDASLLQVVDINRDGILQFGELRMGGDMVMLATPEIAGLPYVVSGMVAAGGLAAALSTADGLLLTIANALSHDVYYKVLRPQASSAQRVIVSKVMLLAVALVAAAAAAQRPADIVFLVSAAFSLAASAFVPALVLGVFWQRANRWGAVCGMVSGLGLSCYYMMQNDAWTRGLLGITSPVNLWFGIQPISAGVFGVPLGVVVIVLVSWLTPAPDERSRSFLNRIRASNGTVKPQ
ncbi:MAG: VC_2705 family sodium/solute symporter [Pseudorhodobacter sp.]|nr:VC_2705 family sodium/solute symporter [Rhizobacter sp.]